MEGFEKLIADREKLSLRNEKALFKRTKTLQRVLFSLLLDRIVLNLETTEEGNIKFNSKNVGRSRSTKGIWNAYRKASNNLGKWIVNGLLNVFDLNTTYIRTVTDLTESRELRSRRLLFESLGYDLRNDEIIVDSWLDSLLGQSEVKRAVVNRLNNALRTRMNKDDFIKQFRNDFTDNKNGLGVVSKNMNFHARNLFQSFDRSTQEVYRRELKMRFAIYSGTKQAPTKESSGTRDFCWRRAGNLYDVETIEGWQNLSWQGKIEGSNIFIALGGYQCRHHLSYVSNEAAELMIKRGAQLNKLGPPKPKKKRKK